MVMSLLRRLTSVRWVPRLRQSKILSTSANTTATDSYIEKYYKLKWEVLNGVVVCGLAFGVCCLYCTREKYKIHHKVCHRFNEGCCPKGLREDDDYIQRDVQKEITAAFCDKTDTDGMFGIVFGAAGTGKSNVLRHICKKRYDKSQSNPSGVLYVELGSDARFAHKIAETCGIPLEPNIIEVVIAKIFPSWKRHLTLPQNDEITALAQVFSIIEEGGLLYKKTYGNKVPVLIIDGADIVAKNNRKLFDGLLEWAKKCANEDSVLVVMGSSDGHVLRYVDKQACKSRAAPFVEVTDFPKCDYIKLEKLFMDKLGYRPKKHEAAQKIHEAAQELHGAAQKIDEAAQKIDEAAQKIDEVAQKIEEEEKKDQAAQKIDQAAQKIDEATQKIDEAAQKIDEAAKKKDEPAQKKDEAAQNEEKTVRADAVWIINEITGGRLTDVYKATRLYKKLVAEDPTMKTETIRKKIKHDFESEIKQALNKAMDDPSDQLQLEIAAAVVDRERRADDSTLSVHELALELVHHGVAKSISEAMKAVEKFVDNNILRYNAKQELVAHSMMAGKVLKDLVTSQQSRPKAASRQWEGTSHSNGHSNSHSNSK